MLLCRDAAIHLPAIWFTSSLVVSDLIHSQCWFSKCTKIIWLDLLTQKQSRTFLAKIQPEWLRYSDVDRILEAQSQKRAAKKIQKLSIILNKPLINSYNTCVGESYIIVFNVNRLLSTWVHVVSNLKDIQSRKHWRLFILVQHAAGIINIIIKVNADCNIFNTTALIPRILESIIIFIDFIQQFSFSVVLLAMFCPLSVTVGSCWSSTAVFISLSSVSRSVCCSVLHHLIICFLFLHSFVPFEFTVLSRNE